VATTAILGSGAGIKRPTLLEITGPLFMSYPVVLEGVPLEAERWRTLLTFHHTALGLILDDHRKGVSKGMVLYHESVRKRRRRCVRGERQGGGRRPGDGGKYVSILQSGSAVLMPKPDLDGRIGRVRGKKLASKTARK